VKTYQDFDQHLKVGMASMAVHLHHNLVGERAYMRKEVLRRKGQSLQDQQQVLELTDASGSESELGSQATTSKSSRQPVSRRGHQRRTSPWSRSPSWSPPATIQTRKRKPSSELGRFKDTHQHHALLQSPFLVGSQSPSPQPSVKLEPRNASIPENAGSPGSLWDPIVLDTTSEEEDWDDDEDTKSWPADFYAVDIVKYFQDHKARPRSVPAPQFFQQRFGLPFRSSTYSDHLARWKSAPQSAKDTVLAARRTPAGLWSAFMRDNPAKDATHKSVSRKLRLVTSTSD
jgi:hypothetical protein